MSTKMDYPAKILIAWGEAISGNVGIRDWLMANGYPELGLFVFALNNKESALKWLIENGHPHLAALAEGASGKAIPLKWLEKAGLEVLTKVAMTGDNDNEATEWLILNGHREMAMIGMRMRSVKNQIEKENNDIHKISPE